MNMKMIGVPEEVHVQLDILHKATGILRYRLIQEAIEQLEEKYKEKIQKYKEIHHEQVM